VAGPAQLVDEVAVRRRLQQAELLETGEDAGDGALAIGGDRGLDQPGQHHLAVMPVDVVMLVEIAGVDGIAEDGAQQRALSSGDVDQARLGEEQRAEIAEEMNLVARDEVKVVGEGKCPWLIELPVAMRRRIEAE